MGIDSAADDDGFVVQGSDVKAEFTTDANGKRVGFDDSAVLSTSGTRITVKDVNNKSFEMDVPGNVAGTKFDDTGKYRYQQVHHQKILFRKLQMLEL